MRIQIQKGVRIHNVESFGNEHFKGKYKGCTIDIKKESSDCYYIIVIEYGGCYCYDGYWHHDGDKTIVDAIAEALDGAMLI